MFALMNVEMSGRFHSELPLWELGSRRWENCSLTWEAEAGAPKLPGIQSLLENCTEESGTKDWGTTGLQ